jgi:hypothetical protein
MEQEVNDPCPRRIGQRAKELGEIDVGGIVQKPAGGVGNGAGVKRVLLTAVLDADV